MVPAELVQTMVGAEAEADLLVTELLLPTHRAGAILVWATAGEIPQLHCREEILQQLQQVVLAAAAELTVTPAAVALAADIRVVAAVTKINHLI
jgi:hypothetical protein